MADDGPPLVRPIPRRPFNFNMNLTTATPPEDEEDDDASRFSPSLDRIPSRFLNIGYKTSSDAGSSISRPQSFMNLTSSTLYGIYSPTASTSDRAFNDRDEDDTPWGTGAHTPVRRDDLDEETYALLRERADLRRRPSTYRTIDTTIPHSQPTPAAATSPMSTALRTGLLFALGVGHGMVLTRFQDSKQWPSLPDTVIKPGYNWLFLTFWGIISVGLGLLLPWIDKLSEDSSKNYDEIAERDGAPVKVTATGDSDSDPATDWTLVMRAIGAFVGIAFAIRKLAWTSTLQVSVTLALVNPLLWWIIDRSSVGFMFSAAVAIIGSGVLLGVNPDMMPAPSGFLQRGVDVGTNSSYGMDSEFYSALSGFASQETVEAGVWILSILFCSCLCFGNVGRRLFSMHLGRERVAGL